MGHLVIILFILNNKFDELIQLEVNLDEKDKDVRKKDDELTQAADILELRERDIAEIEAATLKRKRWRQGRLVEMGEYLKHKSSH